MAEKLDDAFVHALATAETRKEYFDGSGLGIRVTPRGTKSWVYLYHWQGKSRRITLGRFPLMSAAHALKARAEALISLEHGIDPGSELAEERGCPRVRDLSQLYIDRHARPKKRSWREDQRLLCKYVIPRVGHLRANQVRRREIVALLDRVVDGGAPISANRVLAVTRKMFNFAISRDLLEYSPCFRVSMPSKEHSRERVLRPE